MSIIKKQGFVCSGSSRHLHYCCSDSKTLLCASQSFVRHIFWIFCCYYNWLYRAMRAASYSMRARWNLRSLCWEMWSLSPSPHEWSLTDLLFFAVDKNMLHTSVIDRYLCWLHWQYELVRWAVLVLCEEHYRGVQIATKNIIAIHVLLWQTRQMPCQQSVGHQCEQAYM